MFGLFNDEGCVEDGFYSEQEATEALFARYTEEDNLYVALVCEQHPDQPWEGCDECSYEESCSEDDE